VLQPLTKLRVPYTGLAKDGGAYVRRAALVKEGQERKRWPRGFVARAGVVAQGPTRFQAGPTVTELDPTYVGSIGALVTHRRGQGCSMAMRHVEALLGQAEGQPPGKLAIGVLEPVHGAGAPMTVEATWDRP
jgi:hypothetical protein